MNQEQVDVQWSKSYRDRIHDVLCDMKLILFSKEPLIMALLCFLTSAAAMAWAKYQRDTWSTYAYPGYILWIVLTRFGDAYLVQYPWKLCRPYLLKTKKEVLIANVVVLFVVMTELVFFLGPRDKRKWESPKDTTLTFKIGVTVHFILYFGVLFVIPYRIGKFRDPDGSLAEVAPKSKPPTLRKQSKYKFFTQESRSPGAHVVGLFMLLFSFLAITIPYFLGISIFAFGPLVFLPVIVLLFSDSSKIISQHRGYCMLLSIFQLGIHALPSVIINTLMPNGASLASTLLYYIMMAGYGHQWRLIAFNATTPYDHVALLVLFQVFDVIFSNMMFIGVQSFNLVYFILLGMTFGRVFLRESKLPNDIVFWLTGNDGNPQELAELQCTRIRRARQNIMLELLSSLLLPFMFAVDSMTGWDIIVRKSETYQSLVFVFQSAFVLLTARFVAGSLAWYYLKYKADLIMENVREEKAKSKRDVKLAGRPDYNYQMLQPGEFQASLQSYWTSHARYITICAVYGIFNAIIFIGKINGDLDAEIANKNL